MASWPCVAATRTILGFAEPGFQIVEREVAHLIFQAVEIHGCGLLALRRCSGRRVERGRVGWQQLGATRLRCVRVVSELMEDLLAAALIVELALPAGEVKKQCQLRLQLHQGRMLIDGPEGERHH